MKGQFQLLKRSLKRRVYTHFPHLVNAYIRLCWHPKKHSLPYKLAEQSQSVSDFFFIQIGANDGLINDPLVHLIRKYRWKGILLEPQPIVFKEKLTPLYKNYRGILLENAAISKEKGSLPLHIVSFSNKRWATGLASFVKESLLEKIENGYIEQCAKKFGDTLPAQKEEYIKEINVPTVSFADLFSKYTVQKIDLLQIDTEGYDWEIIQLFPFEIFQPRIISFEIERLSNKELNDCKEYLDCLNYTFQTIDRDGLAILKTT